MTGSRSDPAGVIVTSRIIRQAGLPMAVDWGLGVSDGRLYKIEDAIIDGVSVAWPNAPRSQRSLRATAASSGLCWRGCAKRIEHLFATRFTTVKATELPLGFAQQVSMIINSEEILHRQNP